MTKEELKKKLCDKIMKRLAPLIHSHPWTLASVDNALKEVQDCIDSLSSEDVLFPVYGQPES